MIFRKKAPNPKLAAIEKELCSFYEYCKEKGFTQEEMRQICKPLTITVEKILIRRYLKYLLVSICLSLLVYFLLHNETTSWHLAAIGRIAMIQLLPIWNWEKLAGTKCLIPNLFKEAEESPGFDCTLCEAIDATPTESNINPYLLSELYLNVHVPVIITDGLRNWPMFNTSFNISKAILKDERLSNSIPCEQSSNMFSSTLNLNTIVRKSLKFKKWFAHLQNCDFAAVKQFRLIAPRPYFLRPEIHPVQYSWLLMSNNYEAPRFKRLQLIEKYTVFGQVDGSYLVRLSPRLNCADECPVLEIELQKGEALVFTSLWNLEYKPNSYFNNVGIILETY